MLTIEQRIARIEDERELQKVITAYLIAIDEMTNVEAVLNCFTDDAVLDMRGIGYPNIEGQDALRAFFAETFSDMTHHAHYATNFVIDKFEDDKAECRTHVAGMGVTREGEKLMFYLQYHLGYTRAGHSWKIHSFRGTALMPID